MRKETYRSILKDIFSHFKERFMKKFLLISIFALFCSCSTIPFFSTPDNPIEEGIEKAVETLLVLPEGSVDITPHSPEEKQRLRNDEKEFRLYTVDTGI